MQVESASNPNQVKQLEEQQLIVEQLSQQFGCQQSILKNEIQRQSDNIEQQQDTPSESLKRPASEGQSANDSQRPKKKSRGGSDADGGDQKADANSPIRGSKASSEKNNQSITAKCTPLIKKLIDHENGK